MFNSYNNTDLHVAADNGDLENVSKLIESKANVNAVNKNDNTPLHFAATKGYSKIVDKLIFV